MHICSMTANGLLLWLVSDALSLDALYYHHHHHSRRCCRRLNRHAQVAYWFSHNPLAAVSLKAGLLQAGSMLASFYNLCPSALDVSTLVSHYRSMARKSAMMLDTPLSGITPDQVGKMTQDGLQSVDTKQEGISTALPCQCCL